MLWTARPDGRLLHVTSFTVEYTGVAASHLLNGGWTVIVHPEDLPRYALRWKRALATGEEFDSECRLRRADGEYRWHFCRVFARRDRSGRVTLWYGSATDVESQHRNEQRLELARLTLESLVAARTRAVEESARCLREFLDQMPVIAWIKDSGLRYTWVSKRYSSMLGWPAEQLIGRVSEDVLPARQARMARHNDNLTLRAQTPLRKNFTVPVPGGRLLRLRGLRFPFPDETGALGVAGVAEEIPALPGARAQRDGALLDRLSARERQVLQLVADGCGNQFIAQRLGLSPKSVETYRSRLMAKLHLHDLPSLVKLAIRQGITTLD